MLIHSKLRLHPSIFCLENQTNADVREGPALSGNAIWWRYGGAHGHSSVGNHNHTVITEGKKMAFPLQGSSVEFWNCCSLVCLERKMTVKENIHGYVCLPVFSGKQGSPDFSSVAHFQVISRQPSLFVETVLVFPPLLPKSTHKSWFPKLPRPWSWIAALLSLPFVSAPDWEPRQPESFALAADPSTRKGTGSAVTGSS